MSSLADELAADLDFSDEEQDQEEQDQSLSDIDEEAEEEEKAVKMETDDQDNGATGIAKVAKLLSSAPMRKILSVRHKV
jgi:hypothetical protein